MAENKQELIDAAKTAFLKIENEDDRLRFMHWCRKQVDEALYANVRKATSAGFDEIKNIVSDGADKAKDLGSSVIKDIKKAGSSLEETMKSFLGKDGKP